MALLDSGDGAEVLHTRKDKQIHHQAAASGGRELRSHKKAIRGDDGDGDLCSTSLPTQS